MTTIWIATLALLAITRHRALSKPTITTKNQNLLATQSFGRKHCINKLANFVPKFVVHLRMNSKTTKLYQKIWQNLSKKKKTKICVGNVGKFGVEFVIKVGGSWVGLGEFIEELGNFLGIIKKGWWNLGN